MNERGTTDIQTPIELALKVLMQARGVPYIFLLTDGAVQNEPDICNMVEVRTSIYLSVYFLYICLSIYLAS